MKNSFYFLCILFLTTSLEGQVKVDPHTFAKPDEVVVEHLDLNLKVDFEQKTISGRVSLRINNKTGAKELYLDTNRLKIKAVTIDDDTKTAFRLSEAAARMGQPLIVEITPQTKIVHVDYSTQPDAPALQWLEPSQTQDKKHPYLYTQSQAILARSWIPCQDTPSVRITYTAKVQVPPELLAIMSAENPKERNSTGIYEFRMPQRIPSYLLALAVGDIEFRATSERTGVYAEPSVVQKAAWEFAETPKMMQAVEQMYGPYKWGRYDLLVLPPSFPWGGMENPRLTFLTPTLLAGDRSLVATNAHELAHSWSGNLVTNASWNDFWLNEGFTNYLTYRIMERVYGVEYARMLSVQAMQDLEREIRELGATSRDTHLKLNLAGRDPEEGVTAIPYEKGEFLLRTIESHVGREKFDQFLNQYFNDFAFQSLTTEQFLDYLNRMLLASDPKLKETLQIDKWVYGPGIPENIVKVESEAFNEVEDELAEWIKGKSASELEVSNWNTHQWIHFIRKLPENLSTEKMKELDSVFQLSRSGNAEILNEWLVQVIAKQYEPAYPAVERFLASQGRRKYIKLLFTEMARTRQGREMATRIYQKVRPLYHSVTRDAAERILKEQTS